VQHDKELDLTKHKEEIKELLEEDIVSRYHLAEGKIEATFDDDPMMQAAIEVLNDASRYETILQGE
jgi:carboxyl-terminal processing protease